jgi:hypothetical protein
LQAPSNNNIDGMVANVCFDPRLEIIRQTDSEGMVKLAGGTVQSIGNGAVTDEGDLGPEPTEVQVIKEDGRWVICDPSMVGQSAMP